MIIRPTLLGRKVRLVQVNNVVTIEAKRWWGWQQMEHYWSDGLLYELATFIDFAHARQFVKEQRCREASSVVTIQVEDCP